MPTIEASTAPTRPPIAANAHAVSGMRFGLHRELLFWLSPTSAHDVIARIAAFDNRVHAASAAARSKNPVTKVFDIIVCPSQSL
jgi:hypothetical protein